jgi:hypothetical protein
MKWFLIFNFFALSLAHSEQSMVHVWKQEINPVYKGETYKFFKAFIDNPKTCKVVKEDKVYKHVYYLSQDKSMICEIEYLYGKREEEAFCGTAVKILSDGKVQTTKLMETDSNGSIYNMIRIAEPSC